MSIKGSANSLPTDHTGGSCFLPGSSGDAPNAQSPGTRQAFELEVFGRQQNSYYFMAPLPDSFSPELMRSSIGCQRRIQPSNLRSWDTLFPQVLLATRVNLHATPRMPLLPICEEESWGYSTPQRNINGSQTDPWKMHPLHTFLFHIRTTSQLPGTFKNCRQTTVSASRVRTTLQSFYDLSFVSLVNTW